MFYAPHLLARKAPLGQIWLAATTRGKIDRRKLNKLNIIKICEEILNPPVPMALRLSGILMGGVVIVYERKVKLLYDDVSRLLVDLNQTWRVKAVSDPTLLPKGKSQAKHETITLPENQEAQLEEIEESHQLSSTSTAMEFQQTAYFAMRLDSVDEIYIHNNLREADPPQHPHQADAVDITLCERFDSHQTDADLYDRFERFDIEGDDETELNFNLQEPTQIPSTLIPSPPQEEPQQADEIRDQYPEDQVNQNSDRGKEQSEREKEVSEVQQDQKRQGQGLARKRARKPAAFLMDYEQTIIPAQIYQTWLQNSSDIVSRRGRKRKHLEAMSTMKIADLFKLPPVVLACGLFANGSRKIHYPAPLLELWMRNTSPLNVSPPGTPMPPQPQEPPLSLPPEKEFYEDPPFEDFHSGVGSQSMGVSIEKLRADVNGNDFPNEIFMEELRTNLTNNEVAAAEANASSMPRNSGNKGKCTPSSGSGHDFLSYSSEFNSGRFNKKRPLSSSRHSGSSLEAVAEENPWQFPDPNFKLARLSENDPTRGNDLLVETGPTQTPHPAVNEPIDHITDSIRMELKTHFDAPGAPQTESLNQLTYGMRKSGAAHLFYQTCVLASRCIIKVEQDVPYGDILISRGAKM